jgi:hypothetical protein
MNEMEIPTDLASKRKLTAARAWHLTWAVCMENGKQSWRALPKHQHKGGLESIRKTSASVVWKLY